MRLVLGLSLATVLFGSDARSAPPAPIYVTLNVRQSVRHARAFARIRIFDAHCEDPTIVKVEVSRDHKWLHFTGLMPGETICRSEQDIGSFFVTVKAL